LCRVGAAVGYRGGVCRARPGLGGELVGVASPVAVEREAVDHEGVAEEVEVLAGVTVSLGPSFATDAYRSPRPCSAFEEVGAR
jgi:hypothetical protein